MRLSNPQKHQLYLLQMFVVLAFDHPFTKAQEGQVLLTKTVKQVNQIHDLLVAPAAKYSCSPREACKKEITCTQVCWQRPSHQWQGSIWQILQGGLGKGTCGLGKHSYLYGGDLLMPVFLSA
jgi:hypothetical protein